MSKSSEASPVQSKGGADGLVGESQQAEFSVADESNEEVIFMNYS
jgi:hypothetical protein